MPGEAGLEVAVDKGAMEWTGQAKLLIDVGMFGKAGVSAQGYMAP